MVGENIASAKIDLLIYGPSKPIVDNGFSDQFVLHSFETIADLERLTPAAAEKIRGAAVTYNSVRGDSKTLARFPKLEIVSSFGVGYDHIDANYARDHDIVVTNTPDVLTEEVADKALGPRAVIINVARGSVVDEQALIAALKSGALLAAGLDVFEKEPNVPDELKAMQNVVLLPHIGSASVVTRNAMDQLVVENLKAWFAGKPPLTPVAETPVKAHG